MKNYVTLNSDLSELVSQVNAYLASKNIDNPAYKIQLYHRIGTTDELVADIPALTTALADQGLSIKGVGHWSIDHVVRAIPAKVDLLIIPIRDTENSQLNINELKADAFKYVDYVIDHEYYINADCNVVETIDFGSNAILVKIGTVFSLKNINNGRAQFLIAAVNEDVSSYFAV